MLCFFGGTSTELSASGVTMGTYVVGSDPQGIAIDSYGNVFVVNGVNNTVTELNSSGVIISTYTVGSGPRGIAIDATDYVWVSNEYSYAVTGIIGVAKGPQYFPYKGPVFPGGGNI